MKKPLLLLLLLISYFQTQAQRTIPYPIILVHGWTGGSSTWDTFTSYLSNHARLSVSSSNLSFDLNCDNDISRANLYTDVCNYTVGNLGNHDVYVVDFKLGYNKTPNNAYSNEAAAVKQGYAIKLAIQETLIATKAEKVVLLGHSMGGLAIREYLQNSSIWQNDGQHHVAKIVTIGTPHGGSNLGSGDINIYNFFGRGDEASEAVRDLRTSYKTGKRGVYLFGGYESSTYIQRGFASNYFNLDVNCNGRSGDYIVGLNEKSIRNDLDFACIIGGPSFSDGVVTVESQNLNNFYSISAEIFNHVCISSLYCHTEEPHEAIFPMIYALDEPKKYPINIQFDKSYSGFFANQANGSYADTDTYIINCSSKGVLKIACNTSASVNGRITLRNSSGAQISDFSIGSEVNQTVDIPYSGVFFLTFSGNSNNGWARYNYSINFCPMPDMPIIAALGNTSFCEGQSVTLITTNGYEKYQWYKDEVQIEGNINPIIVDQSGIFTVKGYKCDRWNNSTNNLTVTVKPAPVKPIVKREDQPTQFLLTASGSENYQWLFNGNIINGATSETYVPQELGIYNVRVSKNGCENQSESISITMDKPILTINGPKSICDGENTVLVAPVGFSQYKWEIDQAAILTNSRELIATKGGNYRVSTQRGKFVSIFSESITITVNPKPEKPKISLESNTLKSSSQTNNQWYANGVLLSDGTGQIINNIGAGSYVVRVTELGCYSESDPFVITALNPVLTSYSIKLYPNPNKGTFWVELLDNINHWQIEVFDIEGKRILQQKSGRSPEKLQRLELKATGGTYFFKLSTENQSKTLKFLIE